MASLSNPKWTVEELLALGRGYQASAILAAAADLELFNLLSVSPRRASKLARSLHCSVRGLTILLDALASLGLVRKSHRGYWLSADVGSVLSATGEATILGMAQHQANCLRRWAELATVVKSGKPAIVKTSVRGAAGDRRAFIEAMHNISAPLASRIIRAVRPLRFTHLLDVGGASGTWTMAFLRACPEARATLFDLPPVLPLARRRLSAAGLLARVQLVGGDFLENSLPSGADLAWVSAIVHQNSREQNRRLFAAVRRALRPGGRIAIRDVLMAEQRTQPVAGALFAVNMLVATEGGGTYTFSELQEDLQRTGFTGTRVARRDEGMNSIIIARTA